VSQRNENAVTAIQIDEIDVEHDCGAKDEEQEEQEGEKRGEVREKVEGKEENKGLGKAVAKWAQELAV